MQTIVKFTRFFPIVGWLLLALLTLEVAARIDDFIRDGASPIAPHTFDNILRPGPFGREGIPKARYGKWFFNSRGYRGPEINPSLKTILAFGASETFGIHESGGQEYPRQLQDILAKKYSAQLNIVNIAIPGMRHGRVGYLERALDELKPDQVIIYPTPTNYIGFLQPLFKQPSQPVPLDNETIINLRLKEKIEILLKRFSSPKLRTFIEEQSIRYREKKIHVMSVVPEASITAFKKDLECAVDAAQRRNARVLLVTHATYFGGNFQEGDEPVITSWRYFYPSLSPQGFLDLEQRANNAVREVSRQFDTELVDAELLMPRGKDHFSDSVHFTNHGAHQFAELIAPLVSLYYSSTENYRNKKRASQQ